MELGSRTSRRASPSACPCEGLDSPPGEPSGKCYRHRHQGPGPGLRWRSGQSSRRLLSSRATSSRPEVNLEFNLFRPGSEPGASGSTGHLVGSCTPKAHPLTSAPRTNRVSDFQKPSGDSHAHSGWGFLPCWWEDPRKQLCRPLALSQPWVGSLTPACPQGSSHQLPS